MKVSRDCFVSAGHVGAPLPCNAIKLLDVPEMNYLAANGEGEVLKMKLTKLHGEINLIYFLFK